MAKGDKKKKVEKTTGFTKSQAARVKTTDEASESKVSANDSATSFVSESPGVEQESEQDTHLTTSSFSSQPDPIPDKQPEKNDDFYELPALSNIIVQRYEGEKCKEQFHGEGVAYFQGGQVYKGMFSEGLMHGHGLYTWADGVKYEGEFVSNVPMGHGTYTWLDGSSYEGEVYNAIRHGVGTHKCSSISVVYRGQWHHGKRHGKGAIYYNQDMTSWYEGDWVTNNREGWGVRCYPSGDMYEGEWENNARHGEGRMRWLQLGQQYRGTWKNGVQHGQGTHTWFLKRALSSQYPRRNEYRGDFVQGQRHGQGTFSYASGALYQGEWKNNEKHGQGKFIFKNGRIFEGEFVNDHMAEFPSFRLDGAKTPNLSGIRTHTPCPEDGVYHRRLSGSGNDSEMLGPDMALDIGFLLEKIPKSQRDMECQQVKFVALRNIAELRSIYSFYSSLGHAQSPDNTFLLTRLQFFRLLKDCNVHQHGTTLAQIDRLIREDVPPEESHSPSTAMLPCRFLSCVVAVAYHTYHKDMEAPKCILAACFSKLMRDNILPNAKSVKGLLYSDPLHAVVAVNYMERSWETYQAFSRVNPAPVADQTMMTCRHLVWMFKDLGLFDAKLTTGKLLEIITAENIGPSYLSYCNLDLEMTFLEFFETLLGCAEVKCQQAVRTGQEGRPQPSPEMEAKKGSPMEGATVSSLQSTRRPFQSVAATVKSPISPDVSSPKSVETGKSRDLLPLSSPEDTETKQNPQAAANSNSQTAKKDSTDSAEQISDTERREDLSLQESCPVATVVNQVLAFEAELASNPSPSPYTEPTEGGTEKGVRVEDTAQAPESDLDLWIQRTHQFFSQLFFPAYDHSRLLSREVEDERLRQEAQRRIALAKAQQKARLREQREAEERRQEDEEVAAERQDITISSPVASNSSVTITSTGAGLKKT